MNFLNSPAGFLLLTKSIKQMRSLRFSNYLLLCFLILFVSCNKNENASNYSSSLKVNDVRKNLLVELATAPATIAIDPSTATDKTNLSDFFKIEKIVFLEDRALVGSISKVQFMNERIYVLDKKNAKRLFCFSAKGKFLWEYNRPGGGPYEFQKIVDFTINPFKNTIDIFDGGGKKIIQLDTLGNPLREFPVDLFAQNVALIDSNEYVFYTGSIIIDEDIRYKLITVNDRSDVLSKNFDVSKSDEDFRFGLMSNLSQNFNTGNLYYSEILNDTLYKISDKTLYRDIVFDFGKYKVSREEAYRAKPEFLMEYTQKNNLVSSIDGVCETDSMLFLLYPFNGSYRKVFVNKVTRNYHQYERLENDFFRLSDTMISASDGSNFVVILEPYFIHTVNNAFRKVFLERYPGINDAKIADSLKVLTPLFVDAVRSTKVDSNPFLIFIKPKKQ